MTRNRRRGTVALTLLAAAIAVVALLRGRPWSPSPAADGDRAADASSESAGTPAQARDAALAARPRSVSSRKDAGLSSSDEVEPSPVDPKTTIEGRVLGVDGKPVPRLCLTAYPLDPRTRGAPFPEWSIAVTDQDGRFRLLGLVPKHGETTAWIVVEKREGERAGILEASLGAVDVEIPLRPVVSAKIRVLDDRGAPVVGALVATAIAGPPESAFRTTINDTTGADGVATLEGVDALRGERPMLAVSPPRTRSDTLLTATRGDWDLKDLTVRLERALTIEGVVRDVDGRPVARALVHALRDKSSGEEHSESDDAGRFRLAPVARDARLRLWATPRGLLDRAAPLSVVTAQAGDQEVVLTVDGGSPLLVAIDGWPADTFARATLTRQADGEEPRTWSASVGRDGTLRFESVVAGGYTLWVPPPAGESVCVFETGLRPGSAATRVRARPIRDLRVVEESKEAAMLLAVTARIGGVSIAENPGGEPEARLLRGVPGDLTVRVAVAATLDRAADDHPFATGEADAAPGETTVRVPIAEKK